MALVNTQEADWKKKKVNTRWLLTEMFLIIELSQGETQGETLLKEIVTEIPTPHLFSESYVYDISFMTSIIMAGT